MAKHYHDSMALILADFKAPASQRRANPLQDPQPDKLVDVAHEAGQRHDPCLLDTFIAAVRYMEGAPKKPWWKYTAERKRELAARSEERQ